MKISTIIEYIDSGHMALPVFQRGYVWNRDQVRGLMQSLYRGHPVGSLLVWVTESSGAEYRGEGDLPPGVVKLLLDGQQRMTTLYGISRGKPPSFFDGNEQAFSGLFFHLDREEFEFFSPIKMKDDPLWIDVTKLLQGGNKGLGDYLSNISGNPDLAPRVGDYVGRLNQILAVRDVSLHVEEVTGPDKTVEVVVDIFNRVNSGGTKLSQGDLALAKICAAWPEARDEMQSVLDHYGKAGLCFNLDWLLRNVNTVLTGEAKFIALHKVTAEQFEEGLKRTNKSLGYLLDLVSGRLGLDHDRVLFGKYAFPVMARYVDKCGGKLKNAKEQGKLLYWYLHSAMWGRFSGSTESAINQDLESFEREGTGLDGLIKDMRIWHGNPTILPEHFGGWGRGARFYPMLYLLSRVTEARDFGTGIPLKAGMLGHNTGLQIHHIFPKALLKKNGFSKAEVNAIANFCFLTGGTNLEISDKKPEIYFEEIEKRFPGALASQWIPLDRDLWKIDRYLDFLEERKKLIADAANQFSENLLGGALPATSATPIRAAAAQSFAEPGSVPGGVESEEEERLIKECNDWVISQNLPSGYYMYELADPSTGRPLAVVDLAWPNGLQQGLSVPIALLIDEGPETLTVANRAGYKYFTVVDEFQDYVEQVVLGQDDTYTAGPEVDRQYWIDNRSESIVALVDDLITAVGAATGTNYAPNYKRRHVGLVHEEKHSNFVHCNPRMHHIRVSAKVSDKLAWSEQLKSAGLGDVAVSKRDVKFNLEVGELTENRELLFELFRAASQHN